MRSDAAEACQAHNLEVTGSNPVSATELRPGITACIAAHPARVRNGLLERALRSVLAQTHQPAAIVVVNDQEAHGAGWTRRTILAQVRTEWIAWLDSDDEWMPEHLEKVHRTAVETDAVFVYPWFEGNDPLGHFGIPFNPCTPHHTTMTHLVRTELALRVGFEDNAKGPYANEDWRYIVGMSQIACAEGLIMMHLADRTWTYHQHGQNSSGQPGQGDAR